jgi:hypothetical protein
VKFNIRWGEDCDEFPHIEGYEFQTEAEAKAFWLGIQAAQGWEEMTLFNEDETEILCAGNIDEIAEHMLQELGADGRDPRLDWKS